jgi:predicted metal-dependent peptidase
MKSVSKLEKARTQIVLDHPFFASILLKRDLFQTDRISTLAVDQRGTIYYNPDFIETLTVPQLVWGLCHEVMHVVGQHANRLGTRDPKKWNYATDAWINDTLTDAKVGEPIPNTVSIDGSRNKTSEKIYDELPDDNGGQGGQGGASSNGAGNSFDNGLGDEFIDNGLTEDELKEVEAETKVDVAQAAQAAKMKGKLSGKLAEFVAEFIESKVNWYDVLERYMNGFAATSISWARPNRRFTDYLPSVGREPSMGPVAFQVDVSGSVNPQEIAHYNGHIKRILGQCNPSEVHVIYTDSSVMKHEVFTDMDEVEIRFYSGGGTDMRAGFDYMRRHGIEVDVVVTLTDGFTPFPEALEVPAVWCISTKGISAPCGETVHFSITN